jgi:hypothetical protein
MNKPVVLEIGPMRMKALLYLCLSMVSCGALAETTAVFSNSSSLIAAARFTPPRAYRVGLPDAALYTAIVSYRVLDFFSTQPCVHSSYCKEEELPQFVVNTKPGFAAFEFCAAAGEIVSSYALHRRGHGRLARTFDAFSVASGALAVSHNYAITAR